MADLYIPSMQPQAVLDTTSVFRLVDIRKRAAATGSGKMLAGACYVDPFILSFAHPVMQHAGPLVFYCVHGHEVSMFGCAMARVAGREAFYVEGGYEALRELGAPLVEWRI